jgi:hypothetical protein
MIPNLKEMIEAYEHSKIGHRRIFGGPLEKRCYSHKRMKTHKSAGSTRKY